MAAASLARVNRLRPRSSVRSLLVPGASRRGGFRKGTLTPVLSNHSDCRSMSAQRISCPAPVVTSPSMRVEDEARTTAPRLGVHSDQQDVRVQAWHSRIW